MKGFLPALARRPTFFRQISSNPSRRLLLFVMLRSMKFWGVEVKPGQTLKCEPGEHRYLYLSQAALWESKKASGNVQIFVKFNDQKLTLGTLSGDKCPQIKYDLVFEKEFELSHSSKSASVYFCGCKAVQDDGSEGYSGKPEVKEAKANVAKLGGPSVKPKAKAEEAKKVDKPKVDEDGDEGGDSKKGGHAWTPYPAQQVGDYLLFMAARPSRSLPNPVAVYPAVHAARYLMPTTDFELVSYWELD